MNILPSTSDACTDIKISLNSELKQPEFILIPPPTVPGIQDKNSKPPILLFIAYSDNCLSVVPLPAIIVLLSKREILEKLLPNLIKTPSNNPSVNKTFDPAPKKNNLDLINFVKQNIYGNKIVVGMGAGSISSWLRDIPKNL